MNFDSITLGVLCFMCALQLRLDARARRDKVADLIGFGGQVVAVVCVVFGLGVVV
jgi:hypothetical protein